MGMSVDFLQQMRDECYGTSIRCLELSDMIGEHQEIPIIQYCQANQVSPDDLSFEQQKAIFDYISCIKNEEEYSDAFDDDYVQITDEQEEEDE